MKEHRRLKASGDGKIGFLSRLLILLVLLLHAESRLTVSKSTGSIVKCLNTITALEEFTKKGTSCFGCDPTSDTCPSSCQGYIDRLWKDCQGVSLADGIYFDPAKTITGKTKCAPFFNSMVE